LIYYAVLLSVIMKLIVFVSALALSVLAAPVKVDDELAARDAEVEDILARQFHARLGLAMAPTVETREISDEGIFARQEDTPSDESAPPTDPNSQLSGGQETNPHPVSQHPGNGKTRGHGSKARRARKREKQRAKKRDRKLRRAQASHGKHKGRGQGDGQGHLQQPSESGTNAPDPAAGGSQNENLGSESIESREGEDEEADKKKNKGRLIRQARRQSSESGWANGRKETQVASIVAKTPAPISSASDVQSNHNASDSE